VNDPQYPQYPGTTLPIDPQREKRRSLNKKILLIAAFVVTFGAGIGIGAAAGGSSPADANLAAAAPAPTVTVTSHDLAAAPAAPAATVKPTSTPKPTPKPSPTFDDGGDDVLAIVGEDIPAGTWTVRGAPSDCFWGIFKAGSNQQDIIADGLAGGTQRVTLKAGQEFESNDCGVWTKK